MTCTVPFSTFYTNIVIAATSTATTPSISTAFWGGAPSGTPAQDASSSGSIITSVSTSKYYNLVLFNSGGGTIGAAYGFYCVTRLG